MVKDILSPPKAPVSCIGALSINEILLNCVEVDLEPIGYQVEFDPSSIWQLVNGIVPYLDKSHKAPFPWPGTSAMHSPTFPLNDQPVGGVIEQLCFTPDV